MLAVRDEFDSLLYLNGLLPIYLGATVPDAKVDAVEILEEVSVVLGHVELGDELLEVGVVRGDVDPRLGHRVEHAVGVVEAAVLQAQHALGDLGGVTFRW